MKSENLLTSVDKLINGINIKSIYGDPVKLEGKTIIPVAKLSYGFGGGNGEEAGAKDVENKKIGGGFGGGTSMTPLGVLEITPFETRFIRFGLLKKFLITLGIGIIIGMIMAPKSSGQETRD